MKFVLVLFVALTCVCCSSNDKKKDALKENIQLEGSESLEELLVVDDSTIERGKNINVSSEKNQEYTIVSQNVEIISCDKCNLINVATLDKNIYKLDYQQVADFLCTMDSKCSNNVEYAEYSNGVLFKLILNYPQVFVDILSKYPELSNDYLFSQLSSPLLDYDLNEVSMLITGTKGNKKVKKKILSSLITSQ